MAGLLRQKPIRMAELSSVSPLRRADNAKPSGVKRLEIGLQVALVVRHRPPIHAGRCLAPQLHVRWRAWLTHTVEGLVRFHDPRRGPRTRPDYHLSQMK